MRISDGSSDVCSSDLELLAVIIFLVGDKVEDVLRDFLHRLDEFGLMRVSALHAFHEAVEIDVIGNSHASPLLWMLYNRPDSMNWRLIRRMRRRGKSGGFASQTVVALIFWPAKSVSRRK